MIYCFKTDLDKAIKHLIANTEMIKRSLSTIAQSLQNNVVPNVEIPEGISLPIRNDCEFASTEDILKDVAVKKQLVGIKSTF